MLFSTSFFIVSICSLFFMSIFPLTSPWNLATIGFFSPLTLSVASIVQYSSGINASISFSLSHIILKATDWTRPALSPLFIFAHNTGLMLYPTTLSSTLLACCASTRFISIFLASLMAALTALFVISLNVILYISLSSNFNAFERCHEIASPSRSGSVARYTLSAFFTSFLSAARISPFPLIVIYFGSKSCSTSTPI